MKRYLIGVSAVLLVLLTAYLLLIFEPWKSHKRPAPVEPPIGEPYVSPIDFVKLQEKNPDIYAWLDIPGTEISYPLVQSADDDTFYLDHDAYKDYTANGALYTEHQYNTTDGSDRLTVVYGHHMFNGSMFSNLQKYYSDPDTFAEFGEIMVYLPDQMLRYHVFAAIPYDSRHIMMTYEPADVPMVRSFLHSVYSINGIGVNFDEENPAAKEDKLLVLSTCLQGNRKNRYLVVAKLEMDTSTTSNEKE